MRKGTFFGGSIKNGIKKKRNSLGRKKGDEATIVFYLNFPCSLFCGGIILFLDSFITDSYLIINVPLFFIPFLTILVGSSCLFKR